MKDVRIFSTNNEKLAQEARGVNDSLIFNMSENTVDNLIQKEKASKFNSQVEQYNEQLEKNNKDFEESKDKVNYDIEKAEIKPMFNRVLVQQFKVNPFQRMEVKGGIIVDTGGYNPHT